MLIIDNIISKLPPISEVIPTDFFAKLKIPEFAQIIFSKKTLYFSIMVFICVQHTEYVISKPVYRAVLSKMYKKFIRFKRKPPEDIEWVPNFFEYKFFDSNQVECRRHVVLKEPCNQKNCAFYKLQYILDILASAKDTIDLCMYLITCTDLANALIQAQSRGIKVRVIVEEEMSTSSESKVQMLIQSGIIVKSKELPTFMHHKFCLIDANVSYQRKLLTGSLNWTLQGLAGNWENIILIKHKLIVLEYLKEFNYIWDYFHVKPLNLEAINSGKEKFNYRSRDWMKKKDNRRNRSRNRRQDKKSLT